ncbi:hypothetical protein Bca101_066417 [Brassica carinata]
MKQSSTVHSCSYFRFVFFLISFCIFFVTTTHAQVVHRRLWPWPPGPWPSRPWPSRPWPFPWPMEPGPPPNPSPKPDPSPKPGPPPGPSPCPPPKPQPKPPPAPGPSPCPPIPPKPQPKPPPKPQPKPPPAPSPCPPQPPKPKPKPPPAPCPSPKPGPSPSPPKPPSPAPKPVPPPSPSPKPSPTKPHPPSPKPSPPKPPAPSPKPSPPKPPAPSPPNPQNETIPAVFFFGDSIFDTGNNNNLDTKLKSNYRPYGMDFPMGVATGRFSNGRVASDYISKYLGVKEIVPAYLEKKLQQDDELQESDLLTGVSFASGGAGYLPETSESVKVETMLDQLTYFQDYKKRMKNLVGKKKTKQIVRKGAAIVVAGSNDLVYTYFGSGAQRLKNDVDSFTTMMADSAASFVLNQTTPAAVFYFGDSIIDTGNNNNLTTEMKCNFSPYGINFPTGVATGRFSDGKRVRSLLEQLTYFEQYIARAKRLLGKDKTNHLLAKGLAIVVAGNNDLLITYYGQGAQWLIYNIHNFTSMMAKSAASFVMQLHGYGARQIAVIGTPPLGCVPSQRTIKGGLRRDCAQELNYASQLFNAKLFITLDQLAHTLPDSNVFYIDIYSPFSDIAENSQDYGFEEIKKGCCGTGLVEAGILCNRFTTNVCSNIMFKEVSTVKSLQRSHDLVSRLRSHRRHILTIVTEYCKSHIAIYATTRN